MSATEETASDDLGIAYLRDATVVGRGGFAYVYAATDTRFDRRVAVKVFDHLLTDDDRALFEAECRTTGRLDRVPHIITFHDVDFTADGRPCIVMAYLEGGSLADLLRRQGLIPWRRASGYLVSVLEALDTAHRLGVLHRDIKPENILVEDGQAYLTDFGLATLTAAAAGGADVGTAQVIASPLHASPETFAGVRDERSDVYSAASTLYNLIAGHAPFQRDADLSTEAIVERLRMQPPAHLPAGLAPPELNGVLQRALAKDPAQRHQTAGELAAELRGLLADGAATDADGPGATRPPARRARSSGASPARTAPTLPVPLAAPPAGSPPSSAPPAGAPLAPTPGARPTPSTPPAPPATSPTPSPPAPPQPASWAAGSRPGAHPSSLGQRLRGELGLRILATGVLLSAVFAGTIAYLQAGAPDPRPNVVVPRPDAVAAPAGPTGTSSGALAADPDVLPAGSEQQWATNRDQVLAEIRANGWRWDQEARTVSLPAGLVIDLDTCPADWSPYRGLDTDFIRLTQILPPAPSSAIEDNAAGFDAYMFWLLTHGGLQSVEGVRYPAVTEQRDSALDPLPSESAQAAFAVRRLTSGSVDRAADEQSDACVPDPFVPADGPGWADPAGRPWLWSDRLSPTSQGWILGETLVRSFPGSGPIEVTALVADDDVARATEEGLRQFLDRRGRPITLEVLPVAAAVDSTFSFTLDKVASARPDAVLVLTGSAKLCADMAVATLRSPAAAATSLIVSSAACAGRTPEIDAPGPAPWLTLGQPRKAADGEAADGWTAWASAVLGDRAPSTETEAWLEGFAAGWSMHQALLIADQLPGGISRPNLLLAVRAMHAVNPSLVGGVQYGMGGGADGDLIEGAPVLRYVPADRSWVASDVGVVDIAGRTLPCPWDRDRRSCS